MKKLYIACMTALALCTTSCMDFFPKTDLSENQVWESEENFQLFANQFYDWTPTWSTITTSSAFDGYYNTDLNTNYSLDQFTAGTNELETASKSYSVPYERIYDASLLIKEAEGFEDQSAIAQPLGEALFFRAVEYYNLVRYYGDVILVTTPLDINSPENWASRNDRKEVIDQALSDLWKAADMLPEVSSEEGRINRYIALSMLSRIALFEGTWQKFHDADLGGGDSAKSNDYLEQARDAAKDVIDNGGYELFYNNSLVVTAPQYEEAMKEYMAASGMTMEDILHNESFRVLFHLENDVQSNTANLTKSDNKEFIWSRRYRLGYSNGSIQGLNNHEVSAYTRKMATMYLCDNGLPIYYNGQVNPRFKGFNTIHSEFYNRDKRMDDTFIVPEKPFWRFQTGRTSWTDDEYTIIPGESGSGAYMYRSMSFSKGTTGYLNYKFTSERQHVDYYQSQDFPVIRLAEVLLNYAEAVYELSGSISDADLDYSLNKVRLRANNQVNMPPLSNTLVSSNGLSMREEIRRERTVEFALEARRAEDIRRWAIAEEVMNQPFLGVKYQGSNWETDGATKYGFKLDDSGDIYHGEDLYSNDDEGCALIWDTDDLHWSKRNYLMPIPVNQIQLNPNLSQNYGWGASAE